MVGMVHFSFSFSARERNAQRSRRRKKKVRHDFACMEKTLLQYYICVYEYVRERAVKTNQLKIQFRTTDH